MPFIIAQPHAAKNFKHFFRRMVSRKFSTSWIRRIPRAPGGVSGELPVSPACDLRRPAGCPAPSPLTLSWLIVYVRYYQCFYVVHVSTRLCTGKVVSSQVSASALALRRRSVVPACHVVCSGFTVVHCYWFANLHIFDSLFHLTPYCTAVRYNLQLCSAERLSACSCSVPCRYYTHSK